MSALPPVRAPQFIPRADEAPTYGPATRAEAAVQTAIARGYGGRVTDEEMSGQCPASSSPSEGTDTPEAAK